MPSPFAPRCARRSARGAKPPRPDDAAPAARRRRRADRPRGHRGPRARLPGARGPLPPVAAATGGVFLTSAPVEGTLDQDWRAKGAPRRRPARGVGLRARQAETLLDGRHRLRALARRQHAAGPRRQPPARAAGGDRGARPRVRKDEPGRESGWVDLDRLRLAVVPGSSGGRCSARRGGCSATSSGPRTCRASTGPACSTATSRWSSASPRARSSPT